MGVEVYSQATALIRNDPSFYFIQDLWSFTFTKFFLRIYNQLSFFISFIKVLKIYIDEHPIFMNVDILSYVYISSNR